MLKTLILLAGLVLALRLLLGADLFYRLARVLRPNEMRIFDAVARRGAGLRHTLDAKVLRITQGTHVATVAVGVLLIYALAFLPPHPEWGFDDSTRHLFMAAAGVLTMLTLIFFAAYEVRYDRHSVIVRTVFSRRELNWNDLHRIRGDAGQVVRLYAADGRSVQIRKFLSGRDDLLAYAAERLAQNRGDHA